MTLSQWLEKLETIHGSAILLGLDRIKAALNALQILPFNIPIITVAGTNGKGSVVCALEYIYTQAGYRVGSYTSPHLLQFNERIKINTLAVNDELICEALEETHDLALQYQLSYFEAVTLAALWLFKQQTLDVIILEVGLGGRLDAVNSADPTLAVITQIDLDHMDKLGATREAIAQEKAGIFRPYTPVVCGDKAPPTVLKECAQKLNAPFHCIDRDFFINHNQDTWTWHNHKEYLNDLPKNNLLLDNMGTALAVVFHMQAQLPVSLADIRTALPRMQVLGRQQLWHNKCKHLLDVAHNPASMEQLSLRIQKEQSAGRVLMVVSMLGDKDINNSLQPLVEVASHWFIAPLNVARAASIEVLEQALQTNNIPAVNWSCFNTIVEAYQAAFLEACADDLIVVSGSFFTVAEVLKDITQ